DREGGAVVSRQRIRMKQSSAGFVAAASFAFTFAFTFAFAATATGAPAGGAATPWIGLSLGDTGKFGGVRVREVLDGSPGQKAGVAAGDEVLALDERSTPTARQLI